MPAAKALTRLCICEDISEPSTLPMKLIPNSHVLALMYLSWYLLRESSEWSRYSTVSVPPKPGTLMSTPGELSAVLVLLSYSNLKQTLKQGLR